MRVPLYSDDEVIADVLEHYDASEPPLAEDVAAAYTYPLKYVEEVLLEKIRAARENKSPPFTRASSHQQAAPPLAPTIDE